ncbi:MAG: adenosylcobinamide-GDP ribazoletransferase [Bacteroidales bacterium]|jgi:adenosylcobinamide-GDP ribazoletransferase
MFLKNNLKYFLHAIIFYTRIPVGIKIDCTENLTNKSIKYLPLIGWIVGGFSAFVFYFSNLILPVSISIILSMTASILITGAFHEDGFADVCDGFGGGYTKERILEIMKDSRIGAFGVIGIVLILMFKFFLLENINSISIPVALIAGNTISRLAAITVTFSNSYIGTAETSKSKLSDERITVLNLLFALIIGILPILLFQKYLFFILIIPVFITKWLMMLYFRKKIGGYTGDCLGAIQQVCEIVFYLSLIVLCKYI